jgi:predicted metal-dependent RNase
VIHAAFPEFLGKEVRLSIMHDGIDLFESDYTHCGASNVRKEIIDGEPCVIMATSSMLNHQKEQALYSQCEPSRNLPIHKF